MSANIINLNEHNLMRRYHPREAALYTRIPEKVQRSKVKRNEPCPCNSGKKFKKCCLLKVK